MAVDTEATDKAEADPREPGENPELAEELKATLARLRELGTEWIRQIDLRIDRARLGLRGVLFRTVVLLWAALVVVLLTGLGLTRLVSGLAAWIGNDLVTGAIVALLPLAVGWIAWWRVRRKGLARLRRKYAAPGAGAVRPVAEQGR